ncbi:MAG TPA: c-type cytochrome [Candidatus Acidoferrales bacterium]|nr:c-type cytochrome [Candidatus Acidoferrales bacterium]
MRKRIAFVLFAAVSAAATGMLAQTASKNSSAIPIVGQPATPAEIKQEDITVLPNGRGLPDGSGTPDQGEAIYKDQCAGCHGDNGQGKPPTGVTLVGGIGTLATSKPVKTIGSYWPYAISVWDYIHRSMPYTEPGTLSADETYAVTAFLLFKNGIIPRDEAMNKDTLPKVRMPNRDGFIADTRPDVHDTSAATKAK